MDSKFKIAVIGAGTVGLSVALRCIEQFGEDKVFIEIIADKFLQQTTSYGCGGLWEPYQIAGTPDEVVNLWGKISYEHFRDLHISKDSFKAGVQYLTAHTLLRVDDDHSKPSWSSIVSDFSLLNNEDLKSMGMPKEYVSGFRFGTYVVDQKYYMKYLTDKLEILGVKFTQRKIEDIERDFRNSDFDCIVNCTGLGAFDASKDKTMYPIRGQVLRVKAPWIKSLWFFGSSYIIPNVDNVVIGGTAQKGDWGTEVRLEDTKTIVDNIAKVFPSIRDAQIENAWVGLRPGRTPVRLDSEEIKSSYNLRKIKLVNCYGHGGSGITIAMGCAHDVVSNHIKPEYLKHFSDQNYSQPLQLSSWIKIRSKL